MPCDGCTHIRKGTAWRKRENDDWYEIGVHRCFHRNAKGVKNPDKTGGVLVGYVCWVCRGYWRKV